MAEIQLAPGIFDDFERILNHLAHFDVNDATRIDGILSAIDILRHSPEIGRLLGAGSRELIIGRGARGFIALYRFVPILDTVFVLAIRNQRELGYKHGDTKI